MASKSETTNPFSTTTTSGFPGFREPGDNSVTFSASNGSPFDSPIITRFPAVLSFVCLSGSTVHHATVMAYSASRGGVAAGIGTVYGAAATKQVGLVFANSVMTITPNLDVGTVTGRITRIN